MARRDAVGIAIRPVERFGRRDDRLPDPTGSQRDAVVVEEPLEIRLDGAPVAATLRTPGADAFLALGFLFGEGVIRSIDDVGTATPCWRPGQDSSGNVIDVRAAPGVILELERLQGGGRLSAAAGASWGVCGRRSVEALLARFGAVAAGAPVTLELITACVDRLRFAQPGVTRTGGAHAAAAYTATGGLLASHEDVCRHNAVDKVIGELLRRRLVGAGSIAAQTGELPAVLAVSGRVGFETVQRAAAAGIPVVASAAAASSLAIDLAAALRVTLAACVRSGAANVYACPERLGAAACPPIAAE